MKSKQYKFQWFDKKVTRKVMRVSVGTDGKLRVGRILRAELPADIRVGFDGDSMVLAIANGHGSGTSLPESGMVALEGLSEEITATGLQLPLSFRVVWDSDTHFFLGKVIPRKCKEVGTGRMVYDMEQLSVLYGPRIRDLVYRLAKSTPIAERRAIAQEAFYTAIQEYRPRCGDMAAYMEERIRRELLLENQKYSVTFAHRSLDQPLVPESGSRFCLYDTISSPGAGEIETVTDRMAREQFLATLPKKERALIQMLENDIPSSRIQEILKIDEEIFQGMVVSVEQKSQAFFAEAG